MANLLCLGVLLLRVFHGHVDHVDVGGLLAAEELLIVVRPMLLSLWVLLDHSRHDIGLRRSEGRLLSRDRRLGLRREVVLLKLLELRRAHHRLHHPRRLNLGDVSF